MTHDRQRQSQIAQPGRFLILNVEHLLAPASGLVLPVNQDGFVQVLASRREFASKEQCAPDQKMAHDERRLRLLLRRARKQLLCEALTFVKASTRDLERAETGEHRKYLGRVPELAT